MLSFAATTFAVYVVSPVSGAVGVNVYVRVAAVYAPLPATRTFAGSRSSTAMELAVIASLKVIATFDDGSTAPTLTAGDTDATVGATWLSVSKTMSTQ